MSTNERTQGKSIFLSGASGGIGRATAILLAKQGAKLALMSRSADKLAGVADEIVALGGARPIVIAGDVRREADCSAAIEQAISGLGTIDVLINNAGIGIPTDLSTVATADLLNMMETNVNGVVYLTRPALKHMRERKSGHVVMISSRAGLESNPTAPLYCASKFALEGFTEGLRKQADTWRASEGVNIRVSNVRPGNVDSGYWGTRQVTREKFMTCDEVASALAWVIDAPASMNVVELSLESRR